MKQNTLAYTVIRSMVDKIIRDLREDPAGGAKGLIELGALFADTQDQKDVLTVVGRELKRQGSPYHRIVRRVVTETDTELLAGFGMNLGYQGINQGGKTIRKLEARSGVAIPWCILFDTIPGRPLDFAVAAETIRQGKEMGIYTYLFLPGQPSQGMGQMLKLLGGEPDCAFVLLLPPGAVTPAVAQGLRAAKNTAAFVSAAGQDLGPAKAALGVLQQEQCLCGAWVRYTDFAAQALPALARGEAVGASIMIMVDKNPRPVGGEEAGRPLMELRLALPRPVFPVDLYRDIASADRNEQADACRTAVLPDGTVVMTSPDNGAVHTGGNIKTAPLAAILGRGNTSC